MNNLDAGQQFNLSKLRDQQQTALAAGLAGPNILGALTGGLGAFIGGIPRGPRPPKPTCRIGKVTPKPGFILDIFHPDRMRAKVLSDYSRWERLVIWWHSLD